MHATRHIPTYQIKRAVRAALIRKAVNNIMKEIDNND